MSNNLTPLEIDALTEIFNIGIGRAANSLNQMVSQTVDLTIPTIEILPNKEAKEKLDLDTTMEISAVTQRFSGDFQGQALLMFSKENGLQLVSLLLGNKLPIEDLSELEQDSLVEIGNVILNACFGTVINFLDSSISIEMPEFIQGNLNKIFTYSSEHDWSLYLKVKFCLPSENISGYISFIMDITSLEIFQESVRKFVFGVTSKALG
ncbi:chemotaxis protein CheX [Colwellia psychrerythraea]|uniref:CheC, phosphatase, inhibitor of MCP methylation n=1 Tax=Colwellia psychrerythraea TaxID=28229 RepID=A0A099KAN5_COLPS|nr:chemotaxis protein CheX [Colwellia psychrerythraea]KGJ87370.1 CheC, phosphatase, inhibitor of MCP methylation [Colwellia psychrerythraea]